MPSVAKDKADLATRLREFVAGEASLAELERLVFDIRDRWASSAPSERPAEAPGERPLWAAVWMITSTCRDSLLDERRGGRRLLELIPCLEGERDLPADWLATRP